MNINLLKSLILALASSFLFLFPSHMSNIFLVFLIFLQHSSSLSSLSIYFYVFFV